jgi:hypothetical protein
MDAMDVFGIAVVVMFLAFIVWLMTRGAYAWKGGWPGERPNIYGIALLMLVVIGVVITLLTRN